MRSIDDVSGEVIDAAIRIHRELGPGLLESVYETVLAASLQRSGFVVERQKPVDIEFDGLRFTAAFRIDLLVDEQLLVEIKSVERLNLAHAKQLLTYLRLTKQPVGLLLNFAGETMKEGIRRLVNDHRSSQPLSVPPRLRANQTYGA
jgi:iron complex transport system substrate-binding protein